MVDHFSALWGSRKSVRGNEISTEISQINVTVKEYGKKSLAELLAKAEAEEA
ncbi:MAG TPA: S6e family ribosomal protein [Desulfobacteria bacterium]|nr:S6e family ribosomal protein [Desulfobacteria bacterium]